MAGEGEGNGEAQGQLNSKAPLNRGQSDGGCGRGWPVRARVRGLAREAARPAAHKAAAAAAAAPALVDVEAVARRVGLMKGKLHTVSLTRPNLGPTAPVP